MFSLSQPLAPALLTRRTLLGAAALPWFLAGCSTPLPFTVQPTHDPAAEQRVRQSAEAQGLAAYRQITDINISYEGQWRPLVNTVQPEVVDAGFRSRSQERILLPLGMPATPAGTPARASGIVAQAYTGNLGRKQVVWRRGSGGGGNSGGGAAGLSDPAASQGLLGTAAVWLNGVPSARQEALDAAALVAEGYGLFLLGPLWIDGRSLPMQLHGTERVEGRLCDVVHVWLSPGLGRVATDRVALCIDQADHITRRVRFTLEGTVNTQGAVAEVDTFDHERRFGVLWPMRSFERVVHPISLPAHDWHITGLDVNRGYAAQDIAGPEFTGKAAPAAAAL